MANYSEMTGIDPSYRSDHSMVTLTLKFSDFKRGRGLWKFNNSLLSDTDYIKLIKETIEKIKIQYCANVYNIDNLGEVKDEEIQFKISDQLFLETLLMEIRGATISYSSHICKEKRAREDALLQEIKDLTDKQDLTQLEIKHEELENIRKDKLKGAIVRSKAKWILEGEKPSKYFCALESRNFTNKIIPKVIKDNGDICTDQQTILDEIKLFYQNLYTEKGAELCDLKGMLDGLDIPKLENAESENLEGPLTIKEAGQVLKNMKNCKSPGSDGFTAEFFKFFWIDIGNFVVRSINAGYNLGEMSVTQKQGVITCLPKGDKSRHYLKNWRPISLLNIVYKIASGSIANRLKTVLPKLINSDQTGFIAGRYIGENTRLIYDIMNYTEENNIPGLLLFIDFEKAFDSVAWTFIEQVIDFFQFGPSIKRWIKTFQKNISSAVNQGGNLSSFFPISRGCRQGDPISPYIFILCAEILAIKLRSNPDIKGISIDDEEVLLSQFADDTCLILDGSEQSLKSSLKELEFFAKISGLRINYSKTQVIWIGNKKYSNETLCQEWRLQWGLSRFNYLGIEFDVNLQEICRLNYDKKLVKLKACLKSWSRRNISPIGKVTVIKTLAISQLNHLFISLPNPDENFLNILNTLLYNFLWNDGPDKIKRDIVTQDYKNGGIKMINVRMFLKALKSSWMRRLYKDDRKWQCVIKTQINLNKLANFGDIYLQENMQNINNVFWRDVFEAAGKINSKSENKPFRNMPLWYNSLIQIGGEAVYYRGWYEKGVTIVNDLLNGDTFLTFQEFRNKYSVNENFLRYRGIVNCLQTLRTKFDDSLKLIQGNPIVPQTIKVFLENKKGTKPMYSILTKMNIRPTSKRKWEEILDVSDIEWTHIYRNPFIITKDSKLQWFQYRIVHRIIGTNSFLTKIKILNDPLCTFCQSESERIEHLFWSCDKVQSLLTDLCDIIAPFNIQIDYNIKTFVLGQDQNLGRSIVNNIIPVLIKYYIYRTRCQKGILNPIALLNFIKSHYFVSKYISVSKQQIEKFYSQWGEWKLVLETNQ